jgi:hypothetical protein
MNGKKDERVEIAAKVLTTLNSASCAKMTVPTAMHYAGFSEDECKNRAKQMTVRRAKEKIEESQLKCYPLLFLSPQILRPTCDGVLIEGKDGYIIVNS